MSNDQPSVAIDDALVDEVAKLADVCNRSALRRLLGLAVRGRIGRRVDAALREVLRRRAAGEPR